MPVQTLDYQGNAGLTDMSAFNLRLGVSWHGEHVFRCYPTGDALYFIRIGASGQQGAVMAAQFGLLGGLIGYFVNKREKKKKQETLNAIAGSDPRTLLASHKYNFAVALSDIATVTLLPPTMLSGTAGRCIIVLTTGKKRRGLVEDVDNMRAAVTQLATPLGDKLNVETEYDEVKKKFRKPTTGRA